MFFQGNDPVHQTMNRVVAKLEEAKIPYAIVGDMAVNAHRHQRTTMDVDFLVTAEGLKSFRDCYVDKEFTPVAGRPRRLPFCRACAKPTRTRSCRISRSNAAKSSKPTTGLHTRTGNGSELSRIQSVRRNAMSCSRSPAVKFKPNS